MISELYEQENRIYRSLVARKRLFTVVFSVISLFLMVFSITIGQYNISFFRTFEVLFDCILGNDVSAIDRYVIWDLKVPRAIMGVVVGAGLGVSGACMQGVLRNPLADPFTTGISSGASFGATVMILYGMCIVPGLPYLTSIVVNAFVASLIPTAVIVVVSYYRGMRPTVAILIGLSVMYIFSATTSLMKILADPTDLEEVYVWSVGTLGKATWSNIGIVAIVTAVCISSAMLLSRRIDILSCGDDVSKSLGVNPKSTRMIVLVTVSVLTAVSVSITGPIGFVGLIAPHVCRMIIGSDCVHLIPASLVVGAFITVVADSISQSISLVYLPVGSVTALFGGPFFLYLLLRSDRVSG